MKWFYLSYAVPGKFMGAVILRGESVEDAAEKARERGLSPGGQVLGIEVPSHLPPWPYRNRLLTKEDIDAIFPGGGIRLKDANQDDVEAFKKRTTIICEDCEKGLCKVHQ